MAIRVDLTIEQGATFTDESLLVDADGEVIDLTGYTARMDIKADIADTDPVISLTTDNGRIIITPSAGSVLLYLDPAETAAISIERGVYDLEVVSAGGDVTRLMQGAVVVDLNVTV